MQFSRVCLSLVVILAIVAPAAAFGDQAPAKGTVTIYRDTWGVPHIYAKTPAEGAYGLGYAQAAGSARRYLYRTPHRIGPSVRGVGRSKDGVSSRTTS